MLLKNAKLKVRIGSFSLTSRNLPISDAASFDLFTHWATGDCSGVWWRKK
jgi:hypothetical protein